MDEGGRGFSFQADAELDMRMEKEGRSAADAVNRLSEVALADLIYNFGEDDDSRRIAEVSANFITRLAAPRATPNVAIVLRDANGDVCGEAVFAAPLAEARASATNSSPQPSPPAAKSRTWK